MEKKRRKLRGKEGGGGREDVEQEVDVEEEGGEKENEEAEWEGRRSHAHEKGRMEENERGIGGNDICVGIREKGEQEDRRRGGRSCGD